LSEKGHGIVFISHKLDEVLQNSHTISVLRQGKVIGTVDPKQVTKNELANYMVGREVIFDIPHAKFTGEQRNVLTVKNLVVRDKRKVDKVKGVSFEIMRGEILGVAGVDGNGQRELVEALTGLIPITDGEAYLEDHRIQGLNPDSIRKLGVAHIPEDRQKRGLVMDFRIDENLVLRGFDKKPFTNHGLLSYPKIFKNAVEQSKSFDIRPADPSIKVKQLSGGNQQKVILARELRQDPKLIIAMQPTRGLDVGAIQYVQEKLLAKRLEGAAILLVSSELEEVITLSDRIIVMNNGAIIGQLKRKDFNYEKIGLMMGGETVD
jgi:simple sugar transport system ATP-binding protein